MEKYPVFEFLPFETLINKTQNEYYQSLALSDKFETQLYSLNICCK